ncbi:MAG: CPBP family glutamic-type intramembrane protease [Planctomycetia bacterium]|nr:CPBP family glutamic-type intramembrane protease [Planctomycetia bacterium]
MTILWLVIIGSFFLSWGSLFRDHLLDGTPWLPQRNSRRRARWQFQEVLILFGMFLLLPTFLMEFCLFTQSPAIVNEWRGAIPSLEMENGELQTLHPLQLYLTTDWSKVKFVFGVFYAAMLVPFMEEFLFRGVIQGWLMAKERELAFRVRFLWRSTGFLAVLAVAVFFALLHFRTGSTSHPSPKMLQYQFNVSTVANVFILGVALNLLQKTRHATWKDLGLDISHLGSDIRLGTLTFGMVALPTYVLQYLGSRIVPPTIAPDPIALLPISLAFGVLYWRTRRLWPSVVTHMLLNGVSILMMFLSVM